MCSNAIGHARCQRLRFHGSGYQWSDETQSSEISSDQWDEPIGFMDNISFVLYMQPRGDEARAVEFGRRQNHLQWGHRRSGLRLGVMEGHSDHQNGLPCVGTLASEVSVPGPRVRAWYSSQRNG